jgi:hypothetical protein
MPKMLGGLLVVCGLVACDLITGPLPPGAERFAPPAVYARWWAMTEACSGHSGDMAEVDWYRVPGSRFMRGGEWVGGYWNRYTNRIVLAEGGIEHGPMVRHEMLHALVRGDGHPRSQFLGNCASLVSCEGICVDDAGRWHLPRQDYVILPPESLGVISRAELLPRESDGERWFELTVTVRNGRGRPVLVATPDEWVIPRTFGYDLRGPSGGISSEQLAADSSTLFFQPFETRQYLFEFEVKSEPFDFKTSEVKKYHLSTGTYLVRGSYARRWTSYDTVAVSP